VSKEKDIRGEVFGIRRTKAEDWMKAEIDPKELLEIAEKYRRAEVVKFEEGQPFICQVQQDPRIIQTAQGPWEVLDVIDKRGQSMLISLGHAVLAKAVREKMQKYGTLAGKVLIIVYLGEKRSKGKKTYHDYAVYTWEEYQQMKKKGE